MQPLAPRQKAADRARGPERVRAAGASYSVLHFFVCGRSPDSYFPIPQAFSATGDAHVDEFIVASPIERKYLVQRILFAAREELGFAAAGWTVLSIFSRLKNTRSLRNV